MYRLYGSPSTASLAVHWMLLELDIPFELEMLDFEGRAQKSADYLRLNPNGVVPTLIVEGQPVTETGAILMLLAERHPQAGFAPTPGTPERAQWLQWMVWLANGPMASFRLWFYDADLPGIDRAALQAKLEGCWDRVDAHLAGRRYMVGETPTTVDLQLTMLMRWSRNMPRPATAWPNIAAYLAHMRARPALREVHAREGVSDWIND
jgi:glutathione S-transferase